MNDYEAKQEARRERYRELAKKNREESKLRLRQGSFLSDTMNGQPILIGHHSEKSHRAGIKRMDNHMRKASEHYKKAEYYDRKAASVGKSGVSADDPEAEVKLQHKLERLQKNQKSMKAHNKHYRKHKTMAGFIWESGKEIDQDYAQELDGKIEADYQCRGRGPFPSYMLQNNNANIRRIKERIEELREAANAVFVERKHGEITYTENPEINRVQLRFPGKPNDAVRSMLKCYGFRWARSEMAWQRHLNEAGRHKANKMIEWYNERQG